MRDPRFINLEGGLNFRDFGGYPTRDGRTVRKGLLYRCGMLTHIPDHAHDDFAALDIGVICDLRRDDESESSPSPSHGPFACQMRIPIAPGSSPQLQASFADPDTGPQDRIDFMREITREIARDHAEEYRQLFDALRNTSGGFLLHCTAGKDRTGFGAAMILLALGVELDHVFEDYLLTNQADELFAAMQPRFKERYGADVDEENLRIVAGVRDEYLEAAFEAVAEHFGSVERYLDAVGVNARVREELKFRYTH